MLRKSFGLAVAALFVASAAFTANADDKKKPKLTEVTVCPVSGHPASGADHTKVYGKYNVHFCCGDCPAAWDKLSKKEKDAKIKTALKPAPKKAENGGTKMVIVNTCPMTGETVKGEGGGKSIVGNYEVHFCCAGCKAPFDKMTREEQEAKIKTALK